MKLKNILKVSLATILTGAGNIALAQDPDDRPPRPHRGEGGPRDERGPRGEGRGHRRGPVHPEMTRIKPGMEGIAWYPVLRDGIAEAKRSNRPIMFMAAASQCRGISGIF